uniref:Protein kinase domain-containing protein n=2 Tax=Opuntia streptacantha TaxID=393608 RepID=A0A7C8ZM39_OPUST
MSEYSVIPMVLAAVLVLQVECVQRVNNGGCGQQLCGDVIIEYPFGIGPNCSWDNDYYAVSCDNSSLPHRNPKPILTKFNLELIEVQSSPRGDGYGGQIAVKMPGIKVCSANDEIQWNSLDLSRSPFWFDESQNALVSVGCHGSASLYERQGHRIGGCSSTCNPPGQVIDGCNGYYCCQFQDMSGVTKEYIMGVTSGASNGSAGNETSCRSAFLTSRVFLQSDNSTLSAAMINNSVLPVVLLFHSRREAKLSVVHQIAVILPMALPVLGALVSCCCCWLCWHCKTKERRKEVRLRAKYFMGRLEETSPDRDVVEKTKLFTINELKRATENFNGDRILGQGGQGTVYKGMLTNGQVIAVKRSKTFEERQWQQFVNEVILLSQVSHKNIVKLLGCSLESKIPLLVYEFVPNGTLSQHIRNPMIEFSLTWEMRLRIAAEAASAIAYLHSSSSTPIYHRDVNSTNILLGDKYEAKVADFGISKAVHIDQTHLTTCVQGTFGYLDPEYFESSQFSEKSDVYSFGVVLVELLTGQEPIRASKADEEMSLVEYFLSGMNKLCLDAILDPIVVQGNTKDTVISVAILAKRCLHIRGLERPTMKEVAIELEALIRKTSLPVVLRQEPIQIEEADIDQSSIETSSAFTCPTMCGAVNLDGIHCEEQPLFFTT